jgi:predicted GIY-YIG superfamily endonuclease
MLRCSDDSIYVGHTDDLEARISNHRMRHYCGYTAKRLPVSLIFSDTFSTRDEAFAAERRIKRWRRSKKLALARGQWDVIVELAEIRSPERRVLATTGADAPLMVRVPHHERVGRHLHP